MDGFEMAFDERTWLSQDSRSPQIPAESIGFHGL